MTKLPTSVFVFLVLLTTLAFASVVESAREHRSQPPQTDSAILEKRYKTIWDTIGGEVPSMIVHLGASAGNQITVWAKAEHGRGPSPRNWTISCTETNAVSVREEVHDSRFGVSMLVLTRDDGNAGRLSCKLSMGGNSTPLVVPVLSPLPRQESFSFLAYSCNEPFSTEDRKGILARDLSLWLRMDARATGENSGGQLPERPQFVLGVGDQIYVDPDADAEGTERLSFFTGKRSDTFLIRKDSLYAALDVVYRYNFSLTPLAHAFSKLPSYMMWDDHEIRDGWGSQDDELTDPAMIAYFRVARHAFIAHQLLRSYAPGELEKEDYKALVEGSDTLHRQFSYGERMHVLMLDSRSTRARGREIFEETARQNVQDWLSRGKEGQGDLYVLTVGAPLFPSRTRASSAAKIFDSGLKDDLDDGWDSDLNKWSRKKLLKMLAKHFADNKHDRLLVISGDVHYSSLYYLSLHGKVVGQEVVTSGIAHSLPERAQKLNWLADSANRVERFEVRAAGKINASATFAELIVTPGPLDQPPEVKLVFHANGTKAGGGWVLGNTNLFAARNRRLWYHSYDYNYKRDREHLSAAETYAYPVGAVPAGAIMPLPLKLPKLRTRRPLYLWIFGKEVVDSDIQAQSIFCRAPTTEYNKTIAQHWDLSNLTNCKPLGRSASGIDD